MTLVQITIVPIPGTALAEDKDDAKRLRDERILPALQAGHTVELDFAGVELATQSYVHALISEAVRRTGDGVFDLLKFRNAGPGVQNVVVAVFEYTRTAAAAAPVDEPGAAS